MLHSSCAQVEMLLSCHREVPLCKSCKSPGKREVPSQVFVVEVAGGAELTMGVWGGERESKTEMAFLGVVRWTHLWKGIQWELSKGLSW